MQEYFKNEHFDYSVYKFEAEVYFKYEYILWKKVKCRVIGVGVSCPNHRCIYSLNMQSKIL